MTPAPDLFSGEPGRPAAPTASPAPARLAPSSSAAVAALSAPLSALPGVGPALAKRLREAVGGDRILDLLFHLPERYASRLLVSSPADAPDEQEVVLRALVVSLRAARSKTGRPYAEVRTEAAGERLLLRYINGRVDWLARQMPPGTEQVFAGKVKSEAGAFSMLNPLSAPAAVGLPLLEPVWPLVKDLRLSQVARAVTAALERLPDFPEWQDPHLLRREGWPGFAVALRMMQAPEAPPPAGAHARLAYDEVLAKQIALALVRRRARERPGRSLVGDDTLRGRALAAFGHPLTRGQEQALAEMDADMAAPSRMLRLLQGDVGSGKTLVAALAMLRAVEAGAQAALMAPTEVLARQHLRTLTRLCLPAGVRLEFLAGSVKGAQRRLVLAGLAEGSVNIAVGTHALFQEGVRFRDLGLAVVDEQHRFGVAQRLMLAGKGEAGGGGDGEPDARGGADMLVMTATPIPRTLLLTQWGEMAVSRLTEKPAGRRPIATSLHGMRQLPEAVAGIARALDRGARVFWVCPQVTESEATDIAAAETRFAELEKRFGALVGLAHGRLDPELRERALRDFAAGRTRLLVATTVIEVGVDVPEATVMVIERAERFGLSQLHQLRGRVGRGGEASYCMLLYDEGLGLASRERLLILRDTEDGFAIADADFRLRGGGEALGTRQSGAPVFRLGLKEAEAQDRLIAIAHRDAALLVERDPALAEGERGRAARVLLDLFEGPETIRTLDAG